ncbi:NAD-binding protein [Clostridium sp. E02]|uniref:NAD-binding protein n=1 Tax=Clostridium sp. E02 TaxID=2487134 RepID=UPI000F53403C
MFQYEIIVVGCGKVGTTLAEQLYKENHDIVLIDKNPDVIQSISERFDVMGVVGNGTVNKVQMEAGIYMLCCLIAKKAGNCHIMLFAPSTWKKY